MQLMKQQLTAIFAAAILGAAASAQINNAGNAGLISLARNMAASGNYAGALDQLRLVDRAALGPDSRADADFDRAQWLYASGRYAAAADAFGAFLEEYPYAAQRDRAQFGLGNCLLEQGDYAAARKAYAAVHPDALPDDEAGLYFYRGGIAALGAGADAAADRYFKAASRYRPTAQNALFCLGKMAYDKGDYAAAAGLLAKVSSTKAPACEAGLYLAASELAQGRYDSALATALKELEKPSVSAAATGELNRMAGEALFRLDRTDEAVPYIKAYVASAESPEPTALYILGVDDFNNGDSAAALARFRTVAERAEGAVQQSAYLYAGQCQLDGGDVDAAVLSFDKAAAMDCDQSVTEAALFNLAAARYSGQAEPFSSGAPAFEEFLRRYPSSVYADRVAAYLASGYMADNDLERALEVLRGVPNQSKELRVVRQRVLCAMGLKALKENNLTLAGEYLAEAGATCGDDAELDCEVLLAQGMLGNRRSDYRTAAGKLRAYLHQAPNDAANRPVALYQLAYALYGGGDAKGAASYFRQAVPLLVDPAAKADAYNRLGDIAAAHADFRLAGSYYRKSSSANPSAGDYAALNDARMMGYERDHKGKLKALETFCRKYPSSALMPDALLETTEAQISLGRNGDAIKTYRRLIADYPGTVQSRRGYIQMAMTYLDMGRANDAEDAYRSVIKLYPTSDEAAQAAQMLRTLYSDSGRGDEYIAFMNSVEKAPKLSAGEAEELEYSSAVAALKRNGDVARMEQFIAAHPESAKLGGARLLLMRTLRDLGRQDEAGRTADAIIEAASAPDAEIKEAKFTKAKALQAGGKEDEAVEIWKGLAADPADLYGAKSAVEASSALLEAGKTGDALDIAKKFVNSGSPHRYWVARGFIVLSDAYKAQKKDYEARQYLEALRDSYPGKEPDIFMMIDSRLENLK